ncbi:MAG: c-type cytochrome domain-containing protein [Pirellulaceae bacterium]
MHLIHPTSALLRQLRGPSPLLCLSFVAFVSFCSTSRLSISFVSATEIDFEKHVAPILVQNCLKCHNSTKARAGLDLSNSATALKGSEAGEVVVPGRPQESLLIRRAADGSMPPETDGRRLTAEEVAVLAAWVKAGAKWPEGRVLSAAPMNGVQRSAKRSLVGRVLQHFRARRNLAAAE